MSIHTDACIAARDGHPPYGKNDKTPEWPLMWRLSVDQQQAVLDCWHESHDSVRSFLRGQPIPARIDVT